MCRSTAALQLGSGTESPFWTAQLPQRAGGSEGGSVVPTRQRPDASKASPTAGPRDRLPVPPRVQADPFPRVPADPSTAPLHQEVLTGPRAGTIRSSGDETLHYNSRHPKIAKALVRTFELLLKGFDVQSIVAAADCLPRRSKHPLIISLEPTQIRLCQVSVAFDCPLQPPRPGPIGIIHDGVEKLLTLGIEELGRDELPGKSASCDWDIGQGYRPLATV